MRPRVPTKVCQPKVLRCQAEVIAGLLCAWLDGQRLPAFRLKKDVQLVYREDRSTESFLANLAAYTLTPLLLKLDASSRQHQYAHTQSGAVADGLAVPGTQLPSTQLLREAVVDAVSISASHYPYYYEPATGQNSARCCHVCI